MEFLLALAILALIGLGYLLSRVSRANKRLQADARKREASIGQLRMELDKLENEILENKAVLSAVSSLALDVIILLDEDLTIVTHNRPAAEIVAGGSAAGKRLPDVLQSPELLALVELTLQADETLEEQFVIAAVHYRARTHVLRYADDRRYVGIALQDITELVNLSRARRDLVANISHELRTPITRIRLIIEGLFLDADKPKRKASIQSLKEIAMETDALLWLSQELLDLSMIESGQAILRLVKTPLKQAVDESIERFESHAEMKDLLIVSHVPVSLDVLCDVDQIKRVLGNLIHNAIKWSPKKEAITITASPEGEEVSVSVLDNGPGVPDELRQRIFERFYQADISRSGDDGTGLGLAICKHIVEAHGGRIWAEGNRQGSGGRFVFTLLRAEAENEETSAPAMDETSLEKAASALP